jgi:hypothetical protein
MTPADEATFIARWLQGLETAAIAAALGIPPGTAHCRAYTLQQQEKIQPRPRGGRQTPARQRQEIVSTADYLSVMHPRRIRCMSCRPSSRHYTVQRRRKRNQ